MLKNLTKEQKGIILMLVGLILMLFSLGVLEKLLSYVIIAGSIAMIAYGFVLSGYGKKIMQLIKKK